MNDKFLQSKFERDFNQVVRNMAVEEKWSEDQPIPFLFFGSIMTTLGFLQAEIAEDSEDYILVRDIWNLLEGDSRGGVSK